MRRIDRERRQDREDLVDEVLVEPGPLAVGQFVRLEDGDAGLAQIVLQGCPDVLLVRHQASTRGRGSPASCSAGVMPSSLSSVDRVCSMSTRPATRTM